MFAWRAFPARGDASPGAYLTVPALTSAGIRVAFTTRLGGHSRAPHRSLNLSFVSGDDPGVVARNRERVLEVLGAPSSRWTSGKQVHGSAVAEVGPHERGAGASSPDTTLPGVDALWTQTPDTVLSVLTADCVPIVLADPGRRRLAVVHAGWRGIAAGVVANAVERVGEARSSLAAIGPAIGPCCYEVGADVANEVAATVGDEVIRSPANGGRPHLDLWLAARSALRAAGVTEVALAALCTRCEPDRFYSHRCGDDARQGVVAYLAP